MPRISKCWGICRKENNLLGRQGLPTILRCVDSQCCVLGYQVLGCRCGWTRYGGVFGRRIGRQSGWVKEWTATWQKNHGSDPSANRSPSEMWDGEGGGGAGREGEEAIVKTSRAKETKVAESQLGVRCGGLWWLFFGVV